MNDAEYAPRFEGWSTDKLGEMIHQRREQARQAHDRFVQSQQQERRQGKRTFASEQAEQHAHRLEDQVDLLRAELRRRTVEATLPEEEQA